MLKFDYIFHAIEKLTRAIAAAIARRKQGEHEAAEEMLEQACRDGFGVSLEGLAGLPLDGLIAMLQRDGTMEPQLTQAVLELLSAYAEILADQAHDERAREVLRKAFALGDTLEHTAPSEALSAVLDGIAAKLER